jgi:hypothetical protein
MSESADLERRYRRLLRCYPRGFRREHESEMLSVLMAGAETQQERPRLGEAADLIRSALWIRLRPGVPRSQPTVFWAVRLMYLCAALKLLSVPLLPVTHGSRTLPIDIAIGWGVFALLAWAAGKGHHWARVLFAGWVAFHTLALFYDLAHVSAPSTSGWTIPASMIFWLLEVIAVVLILSKQSRSYYQHKPAGS